MKLFFITVLTMLSANALAQEKTQGNTQENKSSADWIIEIGIMKITGEAAESLYESLIAKEKVHPLSTSWDETRIKENKFAKCKLNYYKKETDDDTVWELETAECDIKAPRRTVNRGGDDTL